MIRVESAIYCDAASCMQHAGGWTGGGPLVDEKIRTFQAEYGWRRVPLNNRTVDLCPKCAQELHAEGSLVIRTLLGDDTQVLRKAGSHAAE